MPALRSSSFWTDILLLLILSIIGSWLFGWLLQESLFIYGDNPGQFARLWFGVQYGIQGWVGEWYAGYPELQFYPPGFVLVGRVVAALHHGSLESDYNALLFITALLPAFGCYGFCRYALRHTPYPAGVIAGGASALLALLFPVQWGGVHTLSIGLVGERLAFGLVPFVLWAGWALIESPRIWKLTLTAALLALLTLTHPFHAPAPVLALCLYALAVRVPHTTWIALMGVGVATFGFMAWWLMPLLQYREFAAPLVRATLSETLGWLGADPVPYLWGAALIAVGGTVIRYTKATPTVMAIGGLVLLLPLGIWANHAILIEQFQIYLFDPIRFIAEYYLALILLTGMALTLPFIAPHPPYRVVSWALTIATALLLLLALQNSFSQIQDTPANRATYFYDYWETHPIFAGLWNTLAQSNGRILYTSHYLTLRPQHPNETLVLPTSLKSLTSYFTGRPQVGGTFSHWSPIARLVWQGDPTVSRLPERVESIDDQSFLGVQWERLSDERLWKVAQALNVDTIVTTVGDIKARTFLDNSTYWQSYWNNGYFFLYRPTQPLAGWAFTPNGSVQVAQQNATEWLLHVQSKENTPITLSQTYFPTWQATSNTTPLPIFPNEYGLTTIERGTATTIRLRWHPPQQSYGLTWLTFIGLGIGCVAECLRWKPLRFRASRTDTPEPGHIRRIQIHPPTSRNTSTESAQNRRGGIG